MPNTKISNMTVASALSGSEIVPLLQGGANERTTTQAIADLGAGGPSAKSYSVGWPTAINPTSNIIATIDQASTVQSIVGTVESPVGAAATVSVYKAPSGTALSSGTLLHSGSFDANGADNTNQTLTITSAALAAGDRIGLVTTGGANWTGGTGIGGITVRITTP